MTALNIVSRVLHRDADLLVLDKPAGLAVQPVPPRPGGAVLPSLTDHLDALRFGLPRRPELAHRLDRETSGCLVLGRHRRALARLAELFRTEAVEKTYWALVEGAPPQDEGEIDLALGRRSDDPRDWRMRVDPSGQPARTAWRVLARSPESAWLELRPRTGRTHQLRLHCAAAGWPIRGDATYGQAARAGGLLLHARRVVIPLRPNRPPVAAEAPLPEPFRRAMEEAGLGAAARDLASGPAASP